MNQSPRHRVTLKDIALAVGLSNCAVSLALRNSSEIAPATCLRVQSVARKMGYQPNALAANLARFRWDTVVKPIEASICWLNFWPEPAKLRSYTEFDHYWQGAQACAEKFGYRLEEFTRNEAMPLSRLEKILTTRGVGGILVPPHPTSLKWDQFAWERFSVVRFGRSVDSLPVHNIAADHVANAFLAFNEITARGYRRVGLVCELNKHLNFDAGFLKAQRFVDEESRVPILTTGENRCRSLQDELECWIKKEKPDAIFTNQTVMPNMVRKAGYRVPEDIGVVATNVLDAEADAGIHQNPREIGRVAVLFLVSLLHDNDRGIPDLAREILIKGQWVDGASLPRRN